ncbi:energy-coupling factor ABC transporter ATP-binding protein [Streptantibioticus cattleyicolor]|uniref:ABC transporter ATP-binding protein n=1 Tax=Streptantibioticus cattleyicolor (strain ATCC 35852 / DSM 46488 / JCM 4925 / NBRC 14057 / NRRL 8057) TaxID=1003195 RepID=F8JJV2_STREN|nr:ABC transporter ATP-binding protein [Streptantibioticus cattleyicolor]AEW98622.1 ABC transporter ATP-binding protein [Streptantibioticus cattleyicolor NRRL 8057 = DSM 46488]CCB72319.1 putative enzyme [Streptantibioticus cattleyicolor NRRL 8057 = DSM 46488]
MRITLDDVTVRFGDRTVLDGVSLDLTEHRVGVIGPNGSGKSTLARLLNGLVTPSRGTVRVDGLSTAEHARAVRRRVGFVFQNPDNQIVLPVVAEDMAFGLRNTGVPRKEIPARVERQLARFGVAGLAERPSHALSGGEKQLVALASVLVMEPDTVVFDEPTTLLDLRNRNLIRSYIDAMPQQAVVVTHDLELLCGYDRVLVVDEGRIVHDGKPLTAVPWYVEHCS